MLPIFQSLLPLWLFCFSILFCPGNRHRVELVFKSKRGKEMHIIKKEEACYESSLFSAGIVSDLLHSSFSFLCLD